MPDAETGRRIIVKQTDDEAARFAAETIKTVIRDAVDARGVCWLALAGGTTPRRLYGILARQATAGELSWGSVEVFFSDERDVPQDDVASNFGMIQRTLLDHVPIPVTRIHPMPADAADLAEGAAEYEELVRRSVDAGEGGIPRFDLILLGMGGDGHVASVFPDCEALTERKRLVTACFVPVLGRRRMTFTLPLINAARHVILLVTGDDKAESVAALLGDDEDARRDLPAAGVAPAGGTLWVVLDEAAAHHIDLQAE